MTTENVSHIEYRTGDNSVLNSSISLLPWQFRNSENIIKLLSIIAEMKQRLDDVVVDVAKLRLVTTAYGQQLDNIGAELGVERKGASDEDYRIVLQIRMLRRKSQGTRPNIVEMMARFTGASQEEIDIYVGKEKTTDVYFNDACSSASDTIDELSKMLPILTSYRLVTKTGTKILGFCSVSDSPAQVPALGFTGFGSVADVNQEGGSVGSLVAVSS
jgi:hypothetical protein